MDFHAILLEGLFFLSEDPYPDSKGRLRPEVTDLQVITPGGAKKSVYATLRPLVGQRVYFAGHHVPPNPPDPARWGGGACYWQPAALCPFGHHKNPHRLFNLTAQGVLVYDLDFESASGGWWIHADDGGKVILPLSMALPGHAGRVLGATDMSVEQMRDAAMKGGINVEGLGQRITDLQDLLGELGHVVKGG